MVVQNFDEMNFLANGNHWDYGMARATQGDNLNPKN